MKQVVALLLSLPLSQTAWAQQTPESEILSVLNAQLLAWNQGDVRAFMQGYDDSDSTRFVSSKGVAQGFQKVLARYLAAYPTKEKMGVLSFSELSVNFITEQSAVAVGRWNLERAANHGGNAGGYFTLIFQRKAAGWKIILDHTS
jgi:ketosteroid isomerase-like protein